MAQNCCRHSESQDVRVVRPRAHCPASPNRQGGDRPGIQSGLNKVTSSSVAETEMKGTCDSLSYDTICVREATVCLPQPTSAEHGALVLSQTSKETRLTSKCVIQTFFPAHPAPLPEQSHPESDSPVEEAAPLPPGDTLAASS